MKSLSRIVWQEGMHLAPHHFQAQSRFVEDSIQFAASALWFRPYGLSACEMDSEALKNGTVRVIHAAGVLPDGLSFHIPDSDAIPPARQIGEAFSPARDEHLLLLAIPKRSPDAPNFRLDPATTVPDARFVAETCVLRDETNGRDERPVRIGRKNFRLLLDSEVDERMTTLPLARIRRDGSGRFAYDESYIPPCLDIAASGHLLLLIRNLIGALDEKSSLLAAAFKQDAQALADQVRRDLASFWFLHTIHSSLGLLRHLSLTRRGHPEELYRELSRLAGALCSFSTQTHPRDLPLYDHQQLSECFHALEKHIRVHLDLVVPTNCVVIPLEPVEPYFWAAEIKDPRLIDRSRWMLGIQSAAGEARVIVGTPKLAKLCSEAFVRELVRRAVPGLPLTHLPVPPPQVPARVESQYFGITKAGPCWEHIVQTRRVGIYVPGELPAPQMELVVLLES
ncbi:MAG: type VI secretion system baseplate subunit TssK [Bryobacteraceae bacterium]